MDTVPLPRMRALRAVVDAGDPGCTVADVHRALVRGNRWAAIWELDALEAIGLVDADGPTRDEDPKAIRVYTLASEYRDEYENVASLSIALSIERRGGYEIAHVESAPEAGSGDLASEEPPPLSDAEIADIVAQQGES